METMVREAWTDERLDDLSENVNHRFDRVERDLHGLRGEMERRFDKVDSKFDRVDARFESMQSSIDARFDKVDSKFERIDARFDSIQRWMATGMIGSFIALAGLILTQA
jgi:hypothetical protein